MREREERREGRGKDGWNWPIDAGERYAK